MASVKLFFAVVIVIFGTAYGQSTIKASFQAPRRNGLYPRMDSVLGLPEIREFSLCYRARVGKGNIHTIFSYEFNTTSKIENFIELNTKGPHPIFDQGFEIYGEASVNKTVVTSRCGFPSGRWQHFCYLWSSSDGRLDVYSNGQLCETLYHAKGAIVQGGGKVRIGQQMPKIMGYQRQFEGELTDLHMFDEILSERQIKAMSDCNVKPYRGNLVEWLNTAFDNYDGVMIRNSHSCW